MGVIESKVAFTQIRSFCCAHESTNLKQSRFFFFFVCGIDEISCEISFDWWLSTMIRCISCSVYIFPELRYLLLIVVRIKFMGFASLERLPWHHRVVRDFIVWSWITPVALRLPFGGDPPTRGPRWGCGRAARVPIDTDVAKGVGRIDIIRRKNVLLGSVVPQKTTKNNLKPESIRGYQLWQKMSTI